MNINTILMISSGVVFLLFLVVMYQRSKSQTTIYEEDDYSTLDKVLEAVKIEMVDIITEDNNLGVSEADFDALYKRKARISNALSNAVHGIDAAKVIVIELIRTFIEDNVPIEKVTELLGLSDGMQPSDHVMQEILFYRLKKTHGVKTIEHMFKKYQLDREREIESSSEEQEFGYFVDEKDLHYIYENEAIFLTDDEKIEVLAILVYQKYKGFGVLDTIREMDINGFNCGTSGSIMQNVDSHKKGELKATNSLWLYFKGKYIHMRYVSFGSEDELRRIIQLMVRFNNPGPLTAKRGYLVNTMFDKSRVLALRPPASEYWAIFVRKFTISDPTPQALLVKDYTVRADLPIKMMKYLIAGRITCAVTGRQGSGKTTLMASIMRYIDHRFTIRVIEMAPELYLREIYTTRNALSLQETETVSAAELQDALKKSDAAVSIVGEVATDAVAARMIQMGMTASLFTLFSHHATTTAKLVYTLRNSLVNSGGGFTMQTAEEQVLEVVKMDIHLDYTPEGERFVERITEIVPLPTNVPYPEIDRDNPLVSIAEQLRELGTRTTDRVSFVERDIIRYDIKTHTYYVVNRLTTETENYIRKNLGVQLVGFDKFVMANWGKRTDLPAGEKDVIALSLLDEYNAKHGGDNVPTNPSYTAGFTVHEASEDDKLAEIMVQIKLEDDESGKKIVQTDLKDIDVEQHEDALVMFDFFDGEVKL